MVSELNPNLEKIVSKFERITDPKRRYEYLLWFAKRLPPMSIELQVVENKVVGCVSQVYIHATLTAGIVEFQATSDAQITKGLVAMLVEGLAGLPPEDILKLTPDFIQRTGLNMSLTPSRSNGFYNIFKTMQQKAAGLITNQTESSLTE